MAKQLHDNVSRVKAPSPLGTAIFVGLRTADIFWQYTILQRGWASKFLEQLGGHPIAVDRIFDPSTSYPQPFYMLVLLMSLGSSLKQIVALVHISEQEMPTASAVLIAAFNTIFNSLNTILSLWSATSVAPVSGRWSEMLHTPLVTVGVGAYVIGLLTELVSELQRKAFKKDPVNKGKPYGGGLFSLATNVNYGAYTLWRAGYATISGGLPWGILTFSFFFYDFASRGVPVMDQYLTDRVSVQLAYSSISGLSCIVIPSYKHIANCPPVFLVRRGLQGDPSQCQIFLISWNILGKRVRPMFSPAR